MDKYENMELLARMLPTLSAQLRYALSSIHLASASLAPAEAREQDAALDARAAMLDQNYYQLLRLAGNLSAAACLGMPETFQLQDHDVAALLRDICDRSRQLAELIGVKLVFSAEPESCICAVHRELVEQMMFQLLSNAFKFTPRGGTVTVELRLVGAQVRISVSDTGCGIAADKLPHLFDPYQADDLPAPPHGVGLGLPICRRIAEGHKGTIVAESREGEGACVTVAIPHQRSGVVMVKDVPFDYAGGFNRTLLGLADALPSGAFRVRQQD